MLGLVVLLSVTINPDECWSMIPGGFKGDRVYSDAIQRFAVGQMGCTFVEIGALMGQSTCFMANSLAALNISHVKFDVIDYWASTHERRSDVSFDWLPPEQMRAARKFGKGEMSLAWHHFMLKTRSWDMIRQVVHGSSTDMRIVQRYDDLEIDFVYLDTAHDASITSQELAMWWPKLKDGGWLCGDDYHHTHESESLIAYSRTVDSWFRAKGLSVLSKGQSQFCVEKRDV